MITVRTSSSSPEKNSTPTMDTPHLPNPHPQVTEAPSCLCLLGFKLGLRAFNPGTRASLGHSGTRLQEPRPALPPLNHAAECQRSSAPHWTPATPQPAQLLGSRPFVGDLSTSFQDFRSSLSFFLSLSPSTGLPSTTGNPGPSCPSYCLSRQPTPSAHSDLLTPQPLLLC